MLSLDAVTKNDSKTMSDIQQERDQKKKQEELALQPKNPFGFTGIREKQKPELAEENPMLTVDPSTVMNPFLVNSNPFQQIDNKPLVHSSVFEKPVTNIPFQCRIPQTVLPRYRPRSPSFYLKQ